MKTIITIRLVAVCLFCVISTALCTALCGCGVRAVVQNELPLAVENAAQEDFAEIEVAEMPSEEDETLLTEESIPAVEESPVAEVSRQEDAEVVLEAQTVPVDMIRQESPTIMDYSYDVTVEEVETTEDVDSSTSEIPSMTIPPKTDYEDAAAEVTPVLEIAPSPETVVVTIANLDAVMVTANAYAASVYGCTIDPALDMGNSSYRYPAYASAGADQATVEAKARDIVDYTFQQLIQQNGVTLERLVEAGVRCNVYAYRDGDSFFLYCLYA